MSSMNTPNNDTDNTKLYDKLDYSEDLAMCLKWEEARGYCWC